MYLSEIIIENFRLFGSRQDSRHLHLQLRPGLNLLVGENESGKSAVVDAIRHALLTTSYDYYPLTEDDFHISGTAPATNLAIQCQFRGLGQPETARFVEWLSVDRGERCLFVTLEATIREEEFARTSRGQHISVTVHSGRRGDGPAVEGEMRNFLRATYLRPLRDAQAELSAGRGSRLSQILQAYPGSGDEEHDDFDENDPNCQPQTLSGIVHQAERRIESNPFIAQAKDALNRGYLRDFSIGSEVLEGQVNVVGQGQLRAILEKLELWLRPKPGIDPKMKVPRGLGANNVLFMATELLLLAGERVMALPLLLIEEPEAHLHPQMQLQLIDTLQERAEQDGIQVLMTTHSPNLASRSKLENMIVMCDGQAYPLGPGHTMLEESDYRFLERFLDVTKANLFFAKAVVIVEGDAENILLPTLAELIGKPFSKHGVSVVNVGSRGLFRYSRIFQSGDGYGMPIRVARISDLDIAPLDATYAKPRRLQRYTAEQRRERIEGLKLEDGGPVRTFVSPVWTFEHDLAYGKPGHGYSPIAFWLHVAVQLAKRVASKQRSRRPDHLNERECSHILRKAARTFRQWMKNEATPDQMAIMIYRPLHNSRQASKAVAAQFLAELLVQKAHLSPERMRAHLPDYLVEAIDYVTSTGNGA